LSFSAAGERKGNGSKEKHEEVSRKLLILKGFSVSQKVLKHFGVSLQMEWQLCPEFEEKKGSDILSTT
jgi:hypothetical protein